MIRRDRVHARVRGLARSGGKSKGVFVAVLVALGVLVAVGVPVAVGVLVARFE